MKLFLLLFVIVIAVASFSYAKQDHTIQIRLFIVKSSDILPLIDFQEMKRKGFKIMAEGDLVLAPYKDRFDDIKSISIYVPEKSEVPETVIIKFKDGDSKVTKAHKYMNFGNVGKERVFSNKYFSELREKNNNRVVRFNDNDNEKAQVFNVKF